MPSLPTSFDPLLSFFPGLYWNFQIGGEVLEKIPSTGKVWIFLAIHIFLYNLIARMQIQGREKIYFYIMYVKCVVPENIHTPTTEGIGRRGVKDPGNSRGEGSCMINLVSRGPLIQYGFQKSFLTY